jgi:hypothetical protein
VPPLLLHIFSLLLLVKATIIGLEPCALNADFQHFIPIVNKISLLYGDTLEWWVWVEGRPKDRVGLQIILKFTLTCPQTIYTGLCKCI